MKKVPVEEVVIDGTTYVPKKSQVIMAEKTDGMPFVLIRTYSAGVHCGWLKERKGKEVELLASIRIWKWSGAASLSQLAMEGSNDESGCKFAMPVLKIVLTEAIEIIEMTEMAKNCIQRLATWKN